MIFFPRQLLSFDLEIVMISVYTIPGQTTAFHPSIQFPSFPQCAGRVVPSWRNWRTMRTSGRGQQGRRTSHHHHHSSRPASVLNIASLNTVPSLFFCKHLALPQGDQLSADSYQDDLDSQWCTPKTINSQLVTWLSGLPRAPVEVGGSGLPIKDQFEARPKSDSR